MDFAIDQLVRIKLPAKSDTDAGSVTAPTLRIVRLNTGGRDMIDAALCRFVDEPGRDPEWFGLAGLDAA